MTFYEVKHPLLHMTAATHHDFVQGHAFALYLFVEQMINFSFLTAAFD
jgi:hypothetical protein